MKADILNQRKELYEFLRHTLSDYVKDLDEYMDLDDTLAYVSGESGRDMIVVAADRPSWKEEISYYIEKKDEYRNNDTLFVEVNQSIFGKKDMILDLYSRWINGDLQ